MLLHAVRIFPCIDSPGEFRAVCAICGWSARRDNKDELRTLANTHYQEDEERALKRFVTGLPDV